MRRFALIFLGLLLAASAAEAKPVKKKKKAGKYNAGEYIKEKETKEPVTVSSDTVRAAETKVAGVAVDCNPVTSSPTAPVANVEKPTEEVKTEDQKPNSAQQALEMAKTVVKTVKDNCTTEKSGTIQPDVGVQIVKPGDIGAKESKGERPELSGTVGVSATF